MWDPRRFVALKEERELSLQVISGNQQGSECRPELGVVEEFTSAA